MARTTVRFKPSNVLVERGAALVRTCVSSDTPTTVVPLSLPGEPAREFLSSLRTPETSRSANLFLANRGFSAFLALLPRTTTSHLRISNTTTR